MLRVNYKYIWKYLSRQHRRTALPLLLMVLILTVLNPLICIIHCAVIHWLTQPSPIAKAGNTLFFCDLAVHNPVESSDPTTTYLTTFFVPVVQETSLHDAQSNIATIVFSDLVPLSNMLVSLVPLLMILLIIRFFYIPLLLLKPPTPPPRFMC